MIKVAFAIDAGWMGGVNYFRSLLFAISQIPDRKIEPVILVGKKVDPNILAGLPAFDVLYTSIYDRYSFLWMLNKFLGKFIENNFLLNRLLIKHRIQIFSHTMPSENKFIKTVGWIPDFQHKHLPCLFSRKEIKMRNKQFMKIAKFSDAVILSSHDAFTDFAEFANEYVYKASIMRFTSIPNFGAPLSFEYLKEKYGIDRPYFYVPNQFWKHKNHKVIVDALINLKSSHPELLVLASGATFDHRHPDYFNSLIQDVRLGCVENNFKVLGIIPYQDVIALMTYCEAVINPSLFEGWSTTVEEAKSLDIPMLLSNISVHLEQADSLAMFFPPHDPIALANCLVKISKILRDKKNIGNSSRQSANYKRLVEFGVTFQNIILKLSLNG